MRWRSRYFDGARVFSLVVLLLCIAPLRAGDAAGAGPERPLPPFASLRFSEVNLRAGPGDQYPISWVLTRKGMPVEILDRYELWRKVRDWQGSVGWVRDRSLNTNRTVMIVGQERVLRTEPDVTAAAAARAEAGVVARLLSCRGEWCQIEAGGYDGWLQRGEIWGVRPDEVIE
jgi:SH3-like domain-containing protein